MDRHSIKAKGSATDETWGPWEDRGGKDFGMDVWEWVIHEREWSRVKETNSSVEESQWDTQQSQAKEAAWWGWGLGEGGQLETHYPGHISQDEEADNPEEDTLDVWGYRCILSLLKITIVGYNVTITFAISNTVHQEFPLWIPWFSNCVTGKQNGWYNDLATDIFTYNITQKEQMLEETKHKWMKAA